MTLRQEFHPQIGLVHERWSGTATADEVAEALRGHVESARSGPLRFILSDERDVEEFGFSAADVRGFARSAAGNLEAYTGARWAFVIDRARTTALVMLFKAVLDSELEVQVFSTLEAASAWLQLPSEAASIVHVDERDVDSL